MDRYGQLSKHYYAGSERIASRLAGPSTAFVDAEDLEGDHVDALPALQQLDIRIPVQGWGIGLGQGSFENVPLPGDECVNYTPGSEEYKQCICEQEGTCPDVIYFFHPDHLGSSTFLTDRAGQPYQFVMYLPFGETFAEQRAAGFGTPYLFNAKELDEETGLYYYGARYYDPRVSMWWGVDPLAGEYPDWTPYNYTLNNPINLIDPDGRAPQVGNGPGDPPVGAVIAGTIRSGLLNAIAFVHKYSTPQGKAMQIAGLSHHFGVYEDPNSPLGVSVGHEIKTNQDIIDDISNVAMATLDLAPLSPVKGSVAAFAKMPVFSSGFLKTTSNAFREAYAGGRHAKTLELAMSRTVKQNESTITSLSNRIDLHNSYINKPTIKWKEWSSFNEARKQREINHWKKEIRGFQEQIDITKDVIRNSNE